MGPPGGGSCRGLGIVSITLDNRARNFPRMARPPTSSEDVGGLAMRGKFLARLSRVMLTMPSPRHDPPPGGPMALQLAGDEHRRRPDSTARGIRPGAGVNGRLRTIESA